MLKLTSSSVVNPVNDVYNIYWRDTTNDSYMIPLYSSFIFGVNTDDMTRKINENNHNNLEDYIYARPFTFNFKNNDEVVIKYDTKYININIDVIYDNTTIIISNTPYVFKVKRHYNNTFTLHDPTYKFTIIRDFYKGSKNELPYGIMYCYYFRESDKPCYFQLDREVLKNVKEDVPKVCLQTIGPSYNSAISFYQKNTFSRLSNVGISDSNLVCKEWCAENPAYCDILKRDYCKGEMLNDPVCQEYCKKSTSDCDVVLQEYCASKNIKDVKDSDLCGCFLPSNFYNQYFDALEKRMVNTQLANVNPACGYMPCKSSTLKPRSEKNRKCPDILQCIQNVIIDIQSNEVVIDDIDITQDATCKKSFKDDIQCSDNQIIKAGSCHTCDFGTKPSDDKKSCVDIICGDNQIINNISCETCSQYKVPNETKNACVSCDINSIIQNNKCVKCPDGKVSTEDKTRCVLPSELPKYICKFGKCEESLDGKYDSLSECEKGCKTKFILIITGIIIIFIIILILGILIIKKN